MRIKGTRIFAVLFTGLLLISTLAMAQEVYQQAAAPQSERKAEVASVEGLVAVNGPGYTDWQEVKPGAALKLGDRIRTGPMSSAEIKLDTGAKESLVRLEADSEMGIDELALQRETGAAKTTLDLAIGRVMIKAAHLEGESEFQVTTPTSIVGVRGTGFEVRVSAVGE